MRRLAFAPLAALLLVAACGSGGAGVHTRAVREAIDETRNRSRAYRYVDETLDGKTEIVVDGKVQDDLRYSGVVSLNGKEVYELVVADDSVAVRLIDPAGPGAVAVAAAEPDPITAQALAQGRWVIDHTVAPPLLAAAAAADEDTTADKPAAGLRRENLVGDDPPIDGAQLLNYVERALRGGFGADRFNPEAVDYSPLDDPWNSDADRDLDDEGLRRYDLVVPPLPPRAERGRTQTQPTIEQFRKMAVYTRGDRIVEIRERIAIAERREFRRAEAGRTARYYLELRDDALAGGIQDELRQRDMTYTITDTGDVEVALPTDAVEGILRDVLPALKKIFGFEYLGGAPTPLLPGASPEPDATVDPEASPEGTEPQGSPPEGTAAPATLAP